MIKAQYKAHKDEVSINIDFEHACVQDLFDTANDAITDLRINYEDHINAMTGNLDQFAQLTFSRNMIALMNAQAYISLIADVINAATKEGK